MEIIMLTGDPNIGKTAALHFVHEILVADGAKTTRVECRGAKNQRDFTDVLKYQDKTIRIFTMGDVEAEEELEEIISYKKYNFLICACNNELEHFFSKADHSIVKVKAEGHYNKLKANWDDANKIIKWLKERIPEATSLSVTKIVPVVD